MKNPEPLTAERARAADEFIQRRIGIPALVMMENAGRDCAAACMERASLPMRIAVVCGKGNNGGDGFVCARHLAAAGFRVDVFLFGRVKDLRSEAGRNWRVLRRLNNCGLRPIQPDSVCDLAVVFKPYDVIVDALFGLACVRKWRGYTRVASMRSIRAALSFFLWISLLDWTLPPAGFWGVVSRLTLLSHS
jgi:NAD(P)H-hydrate epimerase